MKQQEKMEMTAQQCIRESVTMESIMRNLWLGRLMTQLRYSLQSSALFYSLQLGSVQPSSIRLWKTASNKCHLSIFWTYPHATYPEKERESERRSGKSATPAALFLNFNKLYFQLIENAYRWNMFVYAKSALVHLSVCIVFWCCWYRLTDRPMKKDIRCESGKEGDRGVYRESRVKTIICHNNDVIVSNH